MAGEMQRSVGVGGQSLIALEGLSHRKRTPGRGTMTTTEKGRERGRQTLPLRSYRGGSMRGVSSGDGEGERWGVWMGRERVCVVQLLMTEVGLHGALFWEQAWQRKRESAQPHHACRPGPIRESRSPEP
jgi:hypothetical protein